MITVWNKQTPIFETECPEMAELYYELSKDNAKELVDLWISEPEEI